MKYLIEGKDIHGKPAYIVLEGNDLQTLYNTLKLWLEKKEFVVVDKKPAEPTRPVTPGVVDQKDLARILQEKMDEAAAEEERRQRDQGITKRGWEPPMTMPFGGEPVPFIPYYDRSVFPNWAPAYNPLGGTITSIPPHLSQNQD